MTTTTTSAGPGQPRTSSPRALRLPALQASLAAWMARHSITALRISLGLVITGFGSLKFFPGASPAADLAMRTTEALTFGIVSGTSAVVATALVEVTIGLALLTGVALRPGLVLMAGWLLGIMAPVVLFPTEMFPDGLPTLTAQYVLKDLILIAAAMVVAAKALGARMIAGPGASSAA